VRLFATLAVVSSICLFVFVLEPTTIRKILLWIEFSSASPGLSGAFIVFSLIATFMGGCFVASWVASGFRP
jgi:hypothetical protein